MGAKKPAADKAPTTVVADDPDDLKGTLKHIGGSQSDQWNNILFNQTIQTLWLKHSDKDTCDRQYRRHRGSAHWDRSEGGDRRNDCGPTPRRAHCCDWNATDARCWGNRH